MGIGSFFTDEFGDGSDDYSVRYNQAGTGSSPVELWKGWDPNAAGTAGDQTAAEGTGAQDRQALLDQAAGINQTATSIGQSATGINQTATGIDQSAQRIGQSAQGMDQTAGSLTGLSDQLGNAPSAAALASSAAEQTGNAQAMSQAASARGANSALMMREAQGNNDARDRGIASDAATAAATEQANRYATRGQLLGAAAGVQNNVAGAYQGQAGALGTAANARSAAAGALSSAAGAQNAAGGLIGSSRTGDLTQRGQDMSQTSNANQLTETSDDAAYAALAAKHNKADSDEGNTLDSAFSAMGLSDMRAKTDVEPLSVSSKGAPAADGSKPSGMSSMLSSLLAAYAGGGGGGGAMMSDERLKTDQRKLVEDKATDSELTALLRKATQRSDSSKPLDTSDVHGRVDTAALDAAQRAQGSRVYGAPPSVPTARFADYQPPTARFADAPPASAPPAAPRDPGYDLAALDNAYQRDQATPPSYMMSDKETKTDRRKLLDMASNPAANEKNLGKVDGFTYRYKPDVAARIGEDTKLRPGIMAQDLEKAPAGKQVVSDTSEGKALDLNRAVGFSLAGVAGLDKRLQRLEAASGGRKKSRAA